MMDRSEKDLLRAKKQLAEAEYERHHLAGQKEQLIRMKADYLINLGDFDQNSGVAPDFLITRNFIAHLDRTIQMVESKLLEIVQRKNDLKRQCKAHFRTFKKYEAMYDRSLRLNLSADEKLLTKELDSFNLSRYVSKS